MGVAAGHHLAEDDHQVVQPHDRVARVAGDDAVLARHGPVAGRSGHDQVARLGIDEHVLDPPQTGEILHRFIDALAQGLVELDLLLQPGERDHPQGRAPPRVVLVPAAASAGCWLRRAARSPVRASFIKGRNTPWGSTQTPVGNSREGAGAAVLQPGLGRDGVGDQFLQRLEVGPVGIGGDLPAPAGAGAHACQDMGAAGDHRRRGPRFSPQPPGPRPGSGPRPPARAWRRAAWDRPPVERRRGPGRTRPQPTGPEHPHPADRPGMPRPSTPPGRAPAKSINTCLNPPLTVPLRDNIFGSIDRTGPL